MSCPTFIARSFGLRTATHLAHLITQSYAQHMALGDFYEGLTDLVDRYAEVYMGLEGRITSFPAVKPPSGTPTEMLTDFQVLIQEELDEDRESYALTSILADLQELTARTLYKLKNLKCST